MKEKQKFKIEKFLLDGVIVEQFKLGEPILDRSDSNDSVSLQKFQNQDGDIPALFKLCYGALSAEIGTINNVIVSISIKIIDNPDVLFNFTGFGSISEQTDLRDFTKFLNKMRIPWEIDKRESQGKSVGVQFQSKSTVVFSFDEEYGGVFQFVGFDDELYRKSVIQSGKL